jgi:uncharacterized RDD family membrane protein YckC
MENQTQQVVSATPQTTTYAGFWWRFLAYIIDDIIISFVNFIILIPMWAFLGFSIFRLSELSFFNDEIPLGAIASLFGLIFFTALISIVVTWLYFALMESSSKQGTLGKMALGIKVTDMDGNRISFLRATGRYFGKILSGMIFMIGYIMAGLTPKKQALHDMLASCLVMKVD